MHVGIHLLLLAAVAAVTGALPAEVTSGRSCYASAEGSSNRRLMGGYRRVAEPLQDSDVMQIQQHAVQRLRTLTESSEENFKWHEGEIGDTSKGIVAFKQLVNGLRYCVRFRVTSTSCTGDNDNSCAETPKVFVCDAAAYRTFRQKVTSENLRLFCQPEQ